MPESDAPLPSALPPAGAREAASAAAEAPADEARPPEGFSPLQRAGRSFFDLLGPVYARRAGVGLVVGLRIAERHLNIQDVAHGGMLTTLADSVLGMNIAMARGRRGGQVTVSMSADFLSSARLGDWLEAHVSISRVGQRLAYASCELKVGERQVLRASAVFAFVDRPLPEAVAHSPLPSADG